MDEQNIDALIKLATQVKSLTEKVGMIGRIQLAIVDKLGENDDKFQARFMSIVLANDSFREDFTEHINEDGDDNAKAMMMDLNQIAHDLREDIDEEYTNG